ncbi:MAG: hypothetical protein GY799_21180 [Desulfobulbaceae bacterium]|nr:hypothetical protein [Desulfobulbaceae bacterium]
MLGHSRLGKLAQTFGKGREVVEGKFENGLIEEWSINQGSIWGHLYYDPARRWEDGTFIRTSRIKHGQDDLKEGDQVQTLNSCYTLGKPVEVIGESD